MCVKIYKKNGDKPETGYPIEYISITNTGFYPKEHMNKRPYVYPWSGFVDE